ncbi:transketolase [Candidatus Woesearchaeota archaeon]|nr:transketolase [Candidatus Woesearchaeota archaeon]
MPKVKELRLMADKLRIHSLKSTSAAGSGHPTTCLSCAEIMSCLFFSVLKEDDEFILSKGHAAPILWAVYAEAGFIPRDELLNLRKFNSVLEGHPTPRMSMVKIATGSLGQGLSAGVGMALAKKLDKNPGIIYVLLGDGETAEGAVWEAASLASHYKLNNLCAVVDVNRLGQSQQTIHGHDLIAYKNKFEAFGWNSIIINGHNVRKVLGALRKARKSKKPCVILAKTIKGKGVSFLEGKEGWHGRALDENELRRALHEFKYWPEYKKVTLKSNIKEKKVKYEFYDFVTNKYALDEMTATRTAFGKALVSFGKNNSKVVVLDGDVKNSTMTKYFFKKFPDRSFECFIAEQNMVGAAMGLSALGFVPFVSTFGAFLTRAYDFIRMAHYSDSNINFIGSHAGVSIGQDGPSQMGLEDLSMFLAMPNSAVIYPCDAVSTEKLIREMGKHKGISYMRTTREKTPVIYEHTEDFQIGGLKVLRKSNSDKALVIGAGITVHEALKAHDLLIRKGINIRVIDLYSVKPIDEPELVKHAKQCRNNVIVVEDHYANGIGPVVSQVLGKTKHLYIKENLYIKEIPRSGKPEELRAKYRINADAIVKAVEKK